MTKNSYAQYARRVDLKEKIPYNKGMDKKKVIKYVVAGVLTAATIAIIAWIFSNSLKVAEASAAQSDSFTQKVQDVFKVIAPNSFIATATGPDFDALENGIRVMAHFCEFALLGGMCFWTYRAYTDKGIWMVAPFSGSALIALVDEILQHFTPNRAFEWVDILTDVGGAWAGCLFAWGTVSIALLVYRKIKAKKERKAESEL